MTKFMSHRICFTCFSSMVESGEFLATSPFSLVDDLGDVSITYFLDMSVPCEEEAHDDIALEQNNA